MQMKEILAASPASISGKPAKATSFLLLYFEKFRKFCADITGQSKRGPSAAPQIGLVYFAIAGG